MTSKINFETNPKIYKHWELNIQENRAFLIMKVDEDAGFFEGYKLKLNSYDIGVDIELADAVQRLRFEHPQINSIIIKSGNEKAFETEGKPSLGVGVPRRGFTNCRSIEN